MSNLGHHLVRRAAEMTYEKAGSGENPQDDQKLRMMVTGGLVLLWVTGILYMSIMSAVCSL